MSKGVEIANIKEAMNGADNTKMITPYSLNQVIKRKAGSGSGTPGVGLNYYWNGTELGVKREDEEDYTFVELKGEPGQDGAPGTPGSNGTNGIDGDDGREIELQVTATYIEWRYVGDVSWTNLIALSSLKGADGTNGTNGIDGVDGVDGKQVQLQKSATHIQWKYDTDVTWTDLVALADLKGADGAPGADGVGVPTGGTTGQALIKSSNVDYDFEWMDVSSGGGDTVYYIPSTEGTASNPIILSEKPVGTYYILDSGGNPTSTRTIYFKRTADTFRKSVKDVLEFSVIANEVDGPLADGINAAVFKSGNGWYCLLSTKDDASGYWLSVFGGQLVNIKDNQTITGVKTFNNLPKSSVVPTEVEHFTNKDYVDNQLSNLISLIYPIGSIYMSAANTNPGVLFGGTWEAWGTGRVPVGVDTSQTEFNTVEKTGGAKTHTLTTAQMPKHKHQGAYLNASNVTTAYNVGYRTSPSSESLKAWDDFRGGDEPHNNLQPYITCYMWKRTD